MYKSCSKCKETKSVVDFNKSSSSKDGLNNYCRACSKMHFKQWVPKAKITTTDIEKFCKTCSEVKPVQEFIPNKDGKGGLYSVCKQCCSVRSSTSRLVPENKIKIKEAGRAYAKQNKDKFNMRSARRRMIRKRTISICLDQEFDSLLIQELYNLAVLREECTGYKWEVDHIIPLVSDMVCGFHCGANLRVIPAYENKSKSNRWWPGMWEI